MRVRVISLEFIKTESETNEYGISKTCEIVQDHKERLTPPLDRITISPFYLKLIEYKSFQKYIQISEKVFNFGHKVKENCIFFLSIAIQSYGLDV